jgi:geranylgeranyl diphosphate synthase type I
MRNSAAIEADLASLAIDLDDELARCGALFVRYLRSLTGGTRPVDRSFQMLSHHLGWLDDRLRSAAGAAGPRVRPALCIMACESAGAPPARALPAVLAIELMHAFSLVQDAGSAGDGLLALSTVVLLEACAPDRLIGPATATAAALTLNRTCLELCEGQFLDREFRARPSISLLQYLGMVDRRTGALFGCATELGALLGGASDGRVRQLGQFGRTLGRAFQMQDDLLGVWGDAAVAGQAAGDVRRRRRGLPAVLAWHRAEGPAADELRRLYAGAGSMTDGAVARTMQLYGELDVRRQARRLVADQFEQAMALLENAEPEAGEAATLPLRQLAALISARS